MKKQRKQPPEAPALRWHYCPQCNGYNVVSETQQHPDNTFTLCAHYCDDCGHTDKEFPTTGHRKDLFLDTWREPADRAEFQQLSTEAVDN